MAGFDFNTPNMLPMGANPFDAGLLSMLAANNPALISQAMAAKGIAPPSANATVNGIDWNQSPVGAYLTPSAMAPGSAADASASPATPGPAQAADATNPWAMLQGVKGPTVPAPIFSGGVSGSQKAPEVGAGAGGASNQLGALVNAIIQAKLGQTPQARPVGTLGSFLQPPMR